MLETEKHVTAFSLRSARADDEAFLYKLYCSTRSEEMASWGWSPSQQEMFLKLQFNAQQRHYGIAFPGADHKIILCDDRSAGRILVYRSQREIRLVDIALLPEARGIGIGASLISKLTEEARAEGKPVTLHVAKTNRAAELYRRLGFSVTADLGGDYKMEFQDRQTNSGG